MLPQKIKYHSKRAFTEKKQPYKKYNNANWTWDKIFQEITEAENNGQYNFIKSVAVKYGINNNTLKKKFSKWKKVPIIADNRGLHNRLFTVDQEKHISEYIKKEYIDKQILFNNDDLQILAVKKWKEWYPTNKDDFKASIGWCVNFKKRWKISSVKPTITRVATTVITLDEITVFLQESKREYVRVGPTNFFNMDELFWKIINCPNSTFGYTGSDNTKIYVSGDIKRGLTALLCMNVLNTYFKTIIIKKGKTPACLKKIILPPNFTGCYSDNGWVNCGIMKILFENIFEFTNGTNAVLLLDKYPVHMTEYVQNLAISMNIKLIYIPTGLTGKHQPLDVKINGTIKAYAKKIWKNENVNHPDKKLTFNDALKHLDESMRKTINDNLVKQSFIEANVIELY